MKLEALRILGHGAFRPLQERAVDALLAGRDVQLLLPTGGGKSLCYQVPAIALRARGEGPTLVVSPLVALMEDQVGALRERGVAAVALHRGTPWRTRDRVLAEPSSQALIYASPERLANAAVRRRLAGRVARVAVDEAHCISEWGHDFRPEYLELGVLREELGAPTLAATATATPRVMDEIRASLRLVDPLVVRGRFERPNLAWEVEHHRGDAARAERVAELLAEAGLGHDPERGRAVVYVATRARAKRVADALTAAGTPAGFYHAGRTQGAREKAQAAFSQGDRPVLVATTAFGMGIDRPDVRIVVHAESPSTLEAYVQQAGRAGRDGRPARCVLLVGPSDTATQARLRGDAPHPGTLEGWTALQDYTFSSTCRERTLVARFDPDAPGEPCGRCDVCRDPERVVETVGRVRGERRLAASARAEKAKRDRAVTLEPEQRDVVVAFVEGLKKPLGKRLVAQGLRGGRSKRAVRWGLPSNPLFGALRGVPELALLEALDQLLGEGRLAAKGKKYPTVWIPDKRVRPARTGPAKTPPAGLLAALKAWRTREARRRRWKPYQVLQDATLKAIVEARPATVAELIELPGIGPARVEKFSQALLLLVSEHPEG